MYEVGVIAHFEAAHRLVGNFGPATRMHGHTYRVEVSLRGERLADDGTLVDIAALQQAVGEVTQGLHVNCLDDVAALAGANTTAEVVATHIANEVATRLDGADVHRADVIAVRVWESPSAFAAHERPLR
ncbi:MAG TPA: 6-carboxytetrahydropterin synthase [Candidatus Sulfotelmatobacter sp.]|nr:6-carboxytetrahydropterin synthase [Candidatus Sulfotelmatobacter sp.]